MVSIIYSSNFEKNLSIIGTFTVFFCCLTVSAEEVKLDAVEVHSPNDIPYDVQTISLSEYDYAFGNLNSVLERIPGFQIQNSGGYGAYSTFTLRGSSAKAVPVYFDGVKVNDPLTGGINLSTFPLWALQSVTVHKALIPAELANNSGTSVINLNSQTIQPKQELKLSTGSFDSRSIAASTSSSQHLVSMEHLSANNDFRYLHNYQTPQYADDDYLTNRKNNQVNRNFVLAKSKGEHNKFKLNFMAIHRQYNAGISNNLNHAEDAEINQKSTLLASNIEKGNWKLYLNTDFASQEYDDSKGEIGLTKETQDISYKKSEVKIVNFTEFKNIHSTISIQGQREETEKSDTKTDTTSNRFIGSNFVSAAQNLTINNNLKFNHSWLSRKSSNTSYESYNSGAGYYFDVNPMLSSGISISKKTRLPTISELHLNQGNITANPDLEPEEFYELNFQSNFHFSKAGGQLELYLRDSKNTIIYSYDARGIGRASNEGSSKMSGLESKIYWGIGQVQINWNIELIDSKNTSNNKGNNGKQLPAFFHASQYFGVSYLFDGIQINLANQRRYNMYYDSANSVKAPNQNTWNISANYNHYPWQLGAHINNVFDKFYTGFKTEPLPGRSFVVTLSFSN